MLTNQRRVYVDQSERRSSRFDQSEEGIIMLTNQRRAGVWWVYRVQGARDSTNQRRVYVDQSEEGIC